MRVSYLYVALQQQQAIATFRKVDGDNVETICVDWYRGHLNKELEYEGPTDISIVRKLNGKEEETLFVEVKSSLEENKPFKISPDEWMFLRGLGDKGFLAIVNNVGHDKKKTTLAFYRNPIAMVKADLISPTDIGQNLFLFKLTILREDSPSLVKPVEHDYFGTVYILCLPRHGISIFQSRNDVSQLQLNYSMQMEKEQVSPIVLTRSQQGHQEGDD